jgi:hypothetical protein
VTTVHALDEKRGLVAMAKNCGVNDASKGSHGARVPSHPLHLRDEMSVTPVSPLPRESPPVLLNDRGVVNRSYSVSVDDASNTVRSIHALDRGRRRWPDHTELRDVVPRQEPSPDRLDQRRTVPVKAEIILETLVALVLSPLALNVVDLLDEPLCTNASVSLVTASAIPHPDLPSTRGRSLHQGLLESPAATETTVHTLDDHGIGVPHFHAHGEVRLIASLNLLRRPAPREAVNSCSVATLVASHVGLDIRDDSAVLLELQVAKVSSPRKESADAPLDLARCSRSPLVFSPCENECGLFVLF